MLKSERQEAILRLTNERHTLSVRTAARLLDISEMTVRRDFDELAAEGSVVRVRGGATAAAAGRGLALSREQTRTERQLLNREAKQKVGARAAELVSEGDTVFLGSGTTVEAMAAALPDMRLRVVTNSLPILSILEDRTEMELLLLGGLYRPKTGALIGPLAQETLSRMGTTCAFVGVNGIFEDKAYASNMDACALQCMALSAANKRYLLADAAKFERRDFYSFYSLDDLTAIVSEEDLAPDARQGAEQFCPIIV